MTNRFLLGPNSGGSYGMFISQPGYDVMSAPSVDMIFDTRLGYYGSVVTSGSAQAPATISFPTMTYVPLAFVALWDGSANVLASQSFSFSSGAYSQQAGLTQEQVQIPYYTVTTNSLIIQQPSWFGNSASNIQNYYVRYIIWRCVGS